MYPRFSRWSSTRSVFVIRLVCISVFIVPPAAEYIVGLDEEQELLQYVIYDTAKKGPKRINLNDPSPSHLSYSPPTSLKIHLSKIDIPELRPRAENVRVASTKAKATLPAAPMTPSEPPAIDTGRGKQKESVTDKAREKERQRAAEKEREREKEREKLQKKAEKEAKKAEKNKKGTGPEPNKLTKPTSPVSPSNISHPPFQAPLPPSPSFPQPEYPAHSGTSFYSGASYLSPPAHSRSNSTVHNMPPPPPSMPAHMIPPPMHPSQRPQSLYGSNTFTNMPYASYGPSYFRP